MKNLLRRQNKVQTTWTANRIRLYAGYPWQPGLSYDSRQEKIVISFHQWLKNMENGELEAHGYEQNALKMTLV